MRERFSSAEVLGWRETTVADLRAYHYGGPIAHQPLHDAFGAARATTPGTWCVVRSGTDTDTYWAVVRGYRPVRAIAITGPGQGKILGNRATEPIVPGAG